MQYTLYTLCHARSPLCCVSCILYIASLLVCLYCALYLLIHYSVLCIRDNDEQRGRGVCVQCARVGEGGWSAGEAEVIYLHPQAIFNSQALDLLTTTPQCGIIQLHQSLLSGWLIDATPSAPHHTKCGGVIYCRHTYQIFTLTKTQQCFNLKSEGVYPKKTQSKQLFTKRTCSHQPFAGVNDVVKACVW